MKVFCFGILILWMASLTFAENPTTAPVATQGTELEQGHDANTSAHASPASAPTAREFSILSGSEADSLRAQQLAFVSETGVEDVKVGAVGTNELIYILVVVLLVVVIIKVI